jgi:phosphatidylinositol 4-kinase
MIPFERRFENDDYPSNLIVSIVDSDYACFNTKTRVPYRVLIETVCYREIEEKN